MRVLVCGVRGSTPAPGADFIRYGGNTSCLALAHDGEPPSLVLDGGTGLRRLSDLLAGRPFRGSVLLGHLHWDHTHGLPFFPAAAHPDSRTLVLLPSHDDPVAVLSRAIGPPHFPLRPDELRGAWRFARLEQGQSVLDGFTVEALEIPHLDSRTFGFRVSDGRATVAYLSDHSPLRLGPGPDGFGAYHDAALHLARNADLLVHDAQLTAAELPERAFLGHSAVEYAIGLGEAAGARRVLLYHHDPDRTDDQIDEIVALARTRAPMVLAASEGSVIDL